MKYVLSGLLAAAFGLVASQSAAHHPYETYVETRQVMVTGTVTEWHYREPHTFVHIVSEGRNGETQRWIVEAPGASQFRRSGVSASSIRPGDRVIVVGSPSRVPADHRVRLKTITRPKDGFRWPASGGA
jgi:hypothetical protein